MNLGNLMTTRLMLKVIAILLAVVLGFHSVIIIDGTIQSSQDESVELPVRSTNNRASSFDVITVPVAGSDDWVSFDTSKEPGTAAEAHVTLSDTMGLRIIADFFGFWNKTTTLNNTMKYNRLEIPGTSDIQVPGKPELPMLTVIVEIPFTVSISVEVLQITTKSLPGYDVAPAQPPIAPYWNPIGQYEEPELVNDIGEEDAVYPSSNVTVVGEIGTEPIILRGRRLLLVNFYPIHYNPATNEIFVHSLIEIDVNYSFPAQIEAPHPSLISPSFEKLFQRILLNYIEWLNASATTKASPLFDIADFESASGAEYLIIVNDTFREAADRLAAWKTRKGVPTLVNTSTEIGTGGQKATSAEIEDFIQNAYDNWGIKPVYVLLFADAEDIPPQYRFEHPGYPNSYVGNERLIASDLHYFTVDGPDILPDISYGRISVDSLEEANIVVDKILNYEISPPGIGYEEFYRNILASSYYQDHDSDGDEDRGTGFAMFCEYARSYLNDTIGYTVHVNYTAPANYAKEPPYKFMLWSEGEVPVQALAEQFDNWHFIDGNDFANMKSNITANYNAGRFLIFHVDHGSSANMYRNEDYPLGPYFEDFDGWAMPRFNTSDIEDLNNGDLLPLVFSSGCSVGWFDGEIDQDFMTNSPSPALYTNNNESLSEVLLRRLGGGAIATIGSSRDTYNYQSDDLWMGIVYAIWPNPQSLSNPPIYELGTAFKFGIIDVISKGTNPSPPNDISDLAIATVNEYHLFGDPELSLWTDIPSGLIVEYPTQIGTQLNQQFVVRVSNTTGHPIADAKVCLQKGTEVYIVEYTNDEGFFIFDIPTITEGELNITVTKHNYIPFLDSMDVVDSIATLSVVPDYGPEGTYLTYTISDFDETLPVNVYIENTHSELIDAGAFVGYEDNLPGGVLGPINIKANQSNLDTMENYVAVVVFHRTSDFVEPDPYIYSQWDPLTWHLAADSLTYNNPCIQLYEVTRDPVTSEIISTTPANSYRLRQNQEYLVRVEVWNAGRDVATQVEVNVTYSNLGADIPRGVIGIFVIDQIGGASIPLDPSTHQSAFAEVFWTPTSAGHGCLRANISQDFDVNAANNLGQENTNVLNSGSPARLDFVISNPTSQYGYPYLELRQTGIHHDIWNVSISGYSSEVLEPGNTTTLGFLVDLPESVDYNEWRIFIVEEYLNGVLVGGFEINVTKILDATTPTTPTITTPVLFCDMYCMMMIIVGGCVAIVGVYVIIRRRS
ncbi:MAG: C25 family cysteine peptidase [Candidatus Sifarchaeia archaeon]